MKKSIRVSTRTKKFYKDNDIELSPVLIGLLQECDRIQTIQDLLWKEAMEQPLITEYTNKAGATNLTATAALKELRSWELLFQGACRSIFKIVRADISDIDDDEENELQDYI